MSRKQTLLVSYLESYLNLQRWLSEWRIAINVLWSTAIIFARAGLRFNQPRPVTLSREPIKWVDTTRYLGVTLVHVSPGRLINQVRKKTAQKMVMLGPLLNRRSDFSIRNGVLLYTTHPPHDGLPVLQTEVRRTHPRPEAAGVTI